MIKTIIFVIIFLFINSLHASNIGSDTGLKIPRYVSTKSDDSNIRVGPSINYPIVLKYITKNYPLLVIEEYDDWRKIIDLNDNLGWIHKSLIKGERNAVINHSEKKIVKIYNIPGGKNIGEIHTRNVVRLDKCIVNWCFILIEKYKGWVKKEYLWGVKKTKLLM